MERQEFAVYRLNAEGMRKAESIANSFAELLSAVESVIMDGRSIAIVRTKLEEACFFAKKGMAMHHENQETK